jgi:hypothetical protein
MRLLLWLPMSRSFTAVAGPDVGAKPISSFVSGMWSRATPPRAQIGSWPWPSFAGATH